MFIFFFFSSRRRHTRYIGDWSSDVCSSDLPLEAAGTPPPGAAARDAAELPAQASDRADRDRKRRAGVRIARLGALAVTSVRHTEPAREGVGWRTNRRRGSAMWR